jgi:type I restriction enzyme M protein
MRIQEFEPEKAWWPNREETEQSWCVPVEDIVARNYNLDIKNPNAIVNGPGDPDELLERYMHLSKEVAGLRDALKTSLMGALGGA